MEEKLRTKPVEGWIELAGRAADEGDLEKAREYLLCAVETDPKSAQAWNALSYFARSKEEEIRALKKVLELQPGHQGAAERLQKEKMQT